MKITVMVLVRSIFLFLAFVLTSAEKVSYISIERPMVQYINKKYFADFQIKSLRHSRNDPKHYFSLSITTLTSFGNNITVDLYIYEYVAQTYRRSYIDMHFRLCDLIEKDNFIGAVLKNALQQQGFNQPCPFEPGTYKMSNMTFPAGLIPKQISFTKGRLWINSTGVRTKESLLSAYLDIELKQYTKKTADKKI